MLTARPVFIGIGGGSGSGKTTLAERLRARICAFSEPPPVVLAMDCYYADLSPLDPAERERRNFDHPEALDWPRLLSDLAALRAGEPIERPCYDFATHTRTSATVRIERPGAVILEGLFALYRDELRRLLDAAIWVEAPERTRLARRLRRDIEERGRTRESVLLQHRETVEPMYRRFVEPTREQAGLIADGEAPFDDVVEATLERCFAPRAAVSR